MSQRGTLSRERIVDAAIEMLDRGGKSHFSMRKLAGAMGVDPMALYHHVPNRAALMHGAVDTVVGECELPEPNGSWQEQVRAICHAFRQLGHRHPGVFLVFATFEDWVPSEHRLGEAMYAALKSGGFPPQATVRAARMLLAYTENFACWELTDWIMPYSADERAKLIESLSEGDFPLTSGLVDQIADVDPDAEFAYGLDVVIRGLETEAGREA